MTREEELQMLKAFIEKNGVTELPPDERGPDYVLFSAWGKPRKKKGQKKKAASKQGKKE